MREKHLIKHVLVTLLKILQELLAAHVLVI